jgi:hypothetical protein
MLAVALLTALILLAVTTAVLLRALGYVHRHPELVTSETPLDYLRCQITLHRIVQRYHEIAPLTLGANTLSWKSPSGHVYTLSAAGVERRRAPAPASAIATLRWADIGGVGVRMQPGFSFADYDRDGSPDRQTTTSYTFALIIVPFQGHTMTIPIPTDDRADAVDFAAHVLAQAERMHKRINVFGFHKPPAPRRQRLTRV